VVGDAPLNLQSTSLVLNAYMLDHEPKYRDWLLSYVDAWIERANANGGVLPSKIGLDGKIGGPKGSGGAEPMAGASAPWCRRPASARTATACRAPSSAS
jgi:hypothetical protein